MIGKLFSSAALALTLGLTSAPLFAQNIHFVSATASVPTSGPLAGALVVSWKEAGLGANELIAYSLTADISSATYACINGGGNHPSASNKETVTDPVSATGSVSSTKSGQITASLAAGPPSPGDLVCPGGQKMVLASVTYSNITLTDTTNTMIGLQLDGPLSVPFCDLDHLTKTSSCLVIQ